MSETVHDELLGWRGLISAVGFQMRFRPGGLDFRTKGPTVYIAWGIAPGDGLIENQKGQRPGSLYEAMFVLNS